MRRKEVDEVQVEVHRGHEIVLNKTTSKFLVPENASIEPCDTIGAARNAIDRSIAELNKGVRRKVLTFGREYYDDERARTIREGELTSWTRPRGYSSRIEGVVVFRTGRENMTPESIYENTPQNRELMERVVDLDKQVITLRKQQKLIKEKQLKCAALPEHLKGLG